MAQGIHVHCHAVAHTGGGVGSGDGDVFHIGGGRDRHLALRQIGLIGQILNVVPQSALAIVDAHSVRVGRSPLDTVADAAPVIGIGVDADEFKEPQFLPQGENLLRSHVGGVPGGHAVHLAHIAQVDGFFALNLQRARAVDSDDNGVGAGGEVVAGCSIFRKGDGVGVVKTPFLNRFGIKNYGTFTAGD